MIEPDSQPSFFLAPGFLGSLSWVILVLLGTVLKSVSEAFLDLCGLNKPLQHQLTEWRAC